MRVLTPEQLDDAVAILHEGGVVVYPTETSYGMGCDAENADAVAKVFAIKGRPVNKGVSIIVSSLTVALRYIYLRPYSRRLAEYYWPGPLTIVAAKMPSSLLAPLCEHDGTHAVRVSSCPVATALAEKFGKAIVATSANISGGGDVYDSSEVIATYGDRTLQPDAYIDAGVLPRTLPSTIIEVGEEGIHILRQGGIVVRKVW